MTLSGSGDCTLSRMLAFSLVLTAAGCVQLGRHAPQTADTVASFDATAAQPAIAVALPASEPVQSLPADGHVPNAKSLSLSTDISGGPLLTQDGLPAVTTLEKLDSKPQPVVEEETILAAGRQINSLYDDALCQQVQTYQAVLGQLHNENALLSSRLARLEERLLAAYTDHRVRQNAAAQRIDSLSQELSRFRTHHAEFATAVEKQQRRDLERLGEIADLVQVLAEAEDAAENSAAPSTE